MNELRAEAWTTHAKTTVVMDDETVITGKRVVAECDTEEHAALFAAAPSLLAVLLAIIDNEEQSAFEDWLSTSCPSGDAESVQRQWEESSSYAEFLGDTTSARAVIAKATGATP